MITWWVVVAAFVFGVGSAVLVAEVAWAFQRAEDGRSGRSGGLPAAPPYDWQVEESGLA